MLRRSFFALFSLAVFAPEYTGHDWRSVYDSSRILYEPTNLAYLMSILRLNGAVKHIIRLLPFGVVITLLACTPDHNLSTFGVGGPVAEDQKNIFIFIFWVAVAVFVVVEGALIYSVVKFRHRKAQDGIVEQVHGNNRLEIAWTIAPVIILVVIAIPTVDLIYRQSTAPVGRDAPLNPFLPTTQ